ncbi:MAG: ABC transporter permease [Rhodocyclaceae bacterium]|jgi:lipopolysaccharide transport system permease protein|nr:ABC transporter permease [Rhodocyclaceae bacterium]
MNLTHTLDFIRDTVSKDTELKYRGSILGIAWLFLPSLVSILLYSLVFSKLMHSRLPGNSSSFAYSIYLCAGLLIWNFFSDVLQRSVGAYTDNANILKKAKFNKLSLIAIAAANSTVQFLIISALFIVFLGISGNLSFSGLATYFMAWLMILALSLPLCAIAALLNIFFRDVGHLIQITLLGLFWCTPIVYPAAILPEGMQRWIILNPLAYPIQFSQSGVLDSPAPQLAGLGITLAIAVLLLMGAVLLHRALASDFLDEL